MMDFVVDKVSEDSFYINLLIGLPKQLEKYKKIGIKSTHLTRKLPISHGDICAWEHKQGILLPEDIRNFYNSTNGFLFVWTFNFGQDKTTIQGKIEINQLQDLNHFYGYEVKEDPGVNTEGERFELKLGNSSKLYELVTMDKTNKVLLVYLNSRYSPTIWISTGPQEFYFLADDFTTYFRMAISHLGIPNWQLLFTPKSVPQWIENMIRLLAPNLLNDKITIEGRRKNIDKKCGCDVFVNKVDINIFKCLPKNPQGVLMATEKEKLNVKSPRKKKLERERSFTRKSLYSIKK